MIKKYYLLLLAVAILGAQPLAAQAQMKPVVARVDAVTLYNDDAKFQEFLAQLPTVAIGPRMYYLLEGDLLQTEAQVRASIRAIAEAQQKQAAAGLAKPAIELKVDTVNNQVNIWGKTERALSYAVQRSTFVNDDEYKAAVDNMKLATTAWVDACPACGVSFTYRSDLDGGPLDLSKLTFAVTYLPNETRFVASSFFPHDPAPRRFLLIAPSYYTSGFDKVGVLRHELGHILGYRHEHIGGIAGCGTEDSNWQAVTAYDPHSVMHYFCGGGGTTTLQLTDVDKTGHRSMYQ